MRISVNGEPRDVAEGLTLAELIVALGTPPRGSAAAVDGEVVPRGDWPIRTLSGGQAVEVLTAVQGG